jgi:hypothetical protein
MGKPQPAGLLDQRVEMTQKIIHDLFFFIESQSLPDPGLLSRLDDVTEKIS